MGVLSACHADCLLACVAECGLSSSWRQASTTGTLLMLIPLLRSMHTHKYVESRQSVSCRCMCKRGIQFGCVMPNRWFSSLTPSTPPFVLFSNCSCTGACCSKANLMPSSSSLSQVQRFCGRDESICCPPVLCTFVLHWLSPHLKHKCSPFPPCFCPFCLSLYVTVAQDSEAVIQTQTQDRVSKTCWIGLPKGTSRRTPN